MEISFLGACKEVGRSAFLVREKSKILLDYGLKMNSEITHPLPPQGFLDAAIVSHAHLDHSGNVPTLYKTSEVPCYCTIPTLPLMELLLKDAMKVAKLHGLRPQYSQTHLKRMLRNTIALGFDKKTYLTDDFSITLHDAGHILGSASALVETKNSNLLYTGDIKFSDTRLHKAAFDNFKDIDALIIESTYGMREHPNRKEMEKKFVEACNEVIESKGNVLIPSFAVGRCQEIITALDANKFEHPVFMDGMAKDAAEIMIHYPQNIKDFNEFYRAMKHAHWVNGERDRKRALEEPSVIVSPAGMLVGGAAINYLFKIKENPNSAVFLSGYQAEHTPGRLLLETKRLRYDDYDLNFSKMRVELFDFSAHASSSELKEFAKKIKPKVAFVVHGEPEQAQHLANWIEEKVGCYVKVPKFGERIEVDKYL